MATAKAEATSVPGIRKKINKKGLSYEVRVRVSGHPPICDTFPSFELAKAFKREMEARAGKGERISTRPDRILITDIVAWFKETVPAEKLPEKDEEGNLLPVEKVHGPVRKISETARLDIINHDLGEYFVSTLTHERIAKYIRVLLETPIPKKTRKKPDNKHPLYNGDKERTYAASSVRKIYYTLKKITEAHARTYDYSIDARMFSGHDIPGAWEGHRDRRLEGDEEKKLIEAAAASVKNVEEWQRAIVILLETGMRAQEFLKSTYDNLSLDGRTLFLPAEIVKKVGRKTKKGIARHVPLSLKAVAAYKEHEATKKAGEQRIFWQWKDTSTFDKAFKRISTRAGCPDVMPHTLRHEATARLFEKNKLTDIQIAKITGHTNMQTLAGYYKYRPQGIAVLLD
jgi:integrase